MVEDVSVARAKKVACTLVMKGSGVQTLANVMTLKKIEIPSRRRLYVSLSSQVMLLELPMKEARICQRGDWWLDKSSRQKLPDMACAVGAKSRALRIRAFIDPALALTWGS
jgi:hypothetical protein